MNEFDSRPNYLFVEYLQYPDEVFATVAAERPFELLVFTAIALLSGWAVTRWLRLDPQWTTRTSLLTCVVATPLFAILAVGMVRSTLDHRPVNASVAAFSRDSLVNELPLNSPYTVIYALYERQRDQERDRIRYGAMDESQVLEIVLTEAGIAPGEQLDPGAAPSMHYQQATRARERPLNLVIILEESLGAQFVGKREAQRGGGQCRVGDVGGHEAAVGGQLSAQGEDLLNMYGQVWHACRNGTPAANIRREGLFPPGYAPPTYRTYL